MRTLIVLASLILAACATPLPQGALQPAPRYPGTFTQVSTPVSLPVLPAEGRYRFTSDKTLWDGDKRPQRDNLIADAEILKTDEGGRRLVIDMMNFNGHGLHAGDLMIVAVLAPNGDIRSADFQGALIPRITPTELAAAREKIAFIVRAIANPWIPGPHRSGDVVMSIDMAKVVPGINGGMDVRLLGATTSAGGQAGYALDMDGKLYGSGQRASIRGYAVLDAAAGIYSTMETVGWIYSGDKVVKQEYEIKEVKKR